MIIMHGFTHGMYSIGLIEIMTKMYFLLVSLLKISYPELKFAIQYTWQIF